MDSDHVCSETIAAEEASLQRRGSVSSIVSRLSTPTSPRIRAGSWSKKDRTLSFSRRGEALPPTSEETPAVFAESPGTSLRSIPLDPLGGEARVLADKAERDFDLTVLARPKRKGTFDDAQDIEGRGEKARWYFRTFTWNRWAAEDVSTAGLIPALVIQALATGILDATTYADFATFASNQTGNCIVLTLAAIRLHKAEVLLTGVSFAGFLVAAFIFGQAGHIIGVRRRAWLLFNQFFQIIFLVIAAILLSPAGPRHTSIGGKDQWAVLFLFAAMSGEQVAMARQSSCAELPTAPMTSTFVDFVADHYLFASWHDPRAAPRNRRVYYVVAMIGGSFVGAALHRFTSSWPVVVLTLLLKFVAWVIIALAKPD